MKTLTEERQAVYGNASTLTGQMCRLVIGDLTILCLHHPEMFHPWIRILNKLLRILYSPTNVDHWVDIRGYTEIVIHHLTAEGKGSD
jgi:hypothetical protein